MVVILVLSILTNHNDVMKHKVHNNEKSVRANETLLLQTDSYQYNHAYLSFSYFLIQNHILKLVACAETQDYCCVIL